jgi:hypothetical protein
MKALLVAAIAAVTPPGAAQGAASPIKVLFQPAGGRDGLMLDSVMKIVLQRPEFVKAAQADAQTLIVSVPEKPDRIGSGDHVGFSFTLGFTRNAEPIGEAREVCDTAALQACADQVAADLLSADALHR